MRIRADFFIGQDESADWIGSLLYNGDKEALPYSLLSSTTAEQFKQEVYQLFMTREDVVLPEMGWIWRDTIECSYCFFNGNVWFSHKGYYLPMSEAITTYYDDESEQTQFDQWVANHCLPISCTHMETRYPTVDGPFLG